ncbi:MAG: flippase-like domain-containing protein [Geminicoccaceae bacterium]
MTRPLLYALWGIALALFLLLVTYHGWSDVAAAMAQAGFGLIIVVLFHIAPMTIDTLAWLVLQPVPARRPFFQLMLFRWYGEAVNALLPVAQVGGDILRGRLHARTGIPGPTALGIVVVDLATTVYAQMAFAAFGLVGFAIFLRGHDDLVWHLGATLLVLGILVLGFFVAQQRGGFTRVVRTFEAMLMVDAPHPRSYAQALDRTIHRLYRRHRPLVMSISLHLLAWLVGAGEIYLAAAFCDTPVTLIQAVVLESLVVIVRAAAFLIPGALGVQEGGFILLGSYFGVPPDQALAISLIRRVRELALGVPGLLVWQLNEVTRGTASHQSKLKHVFPRHVK